MSTEKDLTNSIQETRKMRVLHLGFSLWSDGEIRDPNAPAVIEFHQPLVAGFAGPIAAR